MNRHDERDASNLSHTNRRDFCAELMLTSAGLVLAASNAMRVVAATQDSTVAYPPRQLEGAEYLLPGASLYFTIYFLTTGLHAFHVIVGMSVLIWLLIRVQKRHFSPSYYLPVELGALYWHLVDLVWIFLFPLLYLI